MSETIHADTQADALRDGGDGPAAAGNYPVLTSRKLLALVREYVEVTNGLKSAATRQAALRTDIIAALGGVPVAIVGRYSLNVSTTLATPPTPDRVITRAMVGEVLRGSPGRRGFQQLRVV